MSAEDSRQGKAVRVHVAEKDIFNDWALRLESTAPGAWRSLVTPTVIAGIAFAVLYTLSTYLLTRTPLGAASEAEILAYYGDSQQRTLILASMFIMPFAGIAFLYFMVFLRRMANATGFTISRILANVQLAAGTIFIALLFVATAGLTAVTASVQFADANVDPLFARQMSFFSTNVILMFGMRMASMFVFTSSSIGRGAGLIPNWFGYIGYAVGVLLLLSATFSAWFALLFPAWVVVACIIILWYSSRSPAAARA